MCLLNLKSKLYSFYNKSGNGITKSLVSDIARSISSIRYLSDEFTYYCDPMILRMSLLSSNVNILYMPCDIVELRYILLSNNLVKDFNKCYYTLKFALKHFLDNALLVGYNVLGKGFGQVYVGKLCKLARIVIRDLFAQNGVLLTVLSIVKLLGILTLVSFISSPAGLRSYANLEVVKTAQNFGYSDTNPTSAYNSNTGSDNLEGITYMHQHALSKYYVGAKVRLQVGGLAFRPIDGKIKSMKKGGFIVEWDSEPYKGKRTGFKLDDTVRLSKLEVL